jgi:probable rRNA maturation factor
MNQIEIDNRNNDTINEQDIKSTVDEVLNSFNIRNAFSEVIFVSKEEMAGLNLHYRNIDKPTDVLSFPQTEVKEADTKILGSIVISLEVVKDKRENLNDVIMHGLLHLLNFDHEEDESAWQKAADKINCKL